MGKEQVYSIKCDHAGCTNQGNGPESFFTSTGMVGGAWLIDDPNNKAYCGHHRSLYE
jgi:hypothetical protein